MKIKTKILIGILGCLVFLVCGCGKGNEEVGAALDQPADPTPIVGANLDQSTTPTPIVGTSLDQLTTPTPTVGAALDQPADPTSLIDEFLNKMTMEEKVAQMFIVLPESYVGVGSVTSAGEATKAAVDARPIGGLIYMEGNLQSTEQVRDMLSNLQSYSKERIGLPMFTTIDEEGGTVARISGRGDFGVQALGNMSEIGRSGDVSRAAEVGNEMGQYLSDLGFNVDFAPDADVLSNPDNQVVSKRSFGSEPKMVTDMALAVARGLQAQGVCATFKHFPGHGATSGDTHEGYAYTDKSLEQLRDCELIPFEAAIADEIPFIMVGHISVPAVIGDNTPSSLSHTMITDILRGQMGYDGIVITDAMNMGAIVNTYSSSEAAVKTILAGTDIVLMPADFNSAYQGVISAVEDGSISTERIDESVRRILKVKLGLAS